MIVVASACAVVAGFTVRHTKLTLLMQMGPVTTAGAIDPSNT